MKKVLLLLSACFFLANVHAQEQNMYDEMLNKSLEKYIDDNLKENRERIASGKGVGELDFSEFYINLEGFPDNFEFSQKIKDAVFDFIYVFGHGTYKIFKKVKPVLFLRGPYINGNQLKFSIIAASVRATGRNHFYMTFDPDGSFSCIWEYSCETGEWELKEADWDRNLKQLSD